jgi:hypothetical protein
MLNIIDPGADIANRVVTAQSDVKSRLFLRPGKYRIVASDRTNRTLSSREVDIAAGAKP